jgi:hypothetical protein
MKHAIDKQITSLQRSMMTSILLKKKQQFIMRALLKKNKTK